MKNTEKDAVADAKLYKTMYLHLFNAATDALEALDAGAVGKAKRLLIRAQQACEEIYISDED